MKHLFHRLSKLAQIVVPVVFLAIFAGVPPLWAGVSALLVLDFAAIMWVGEDDSQGGRRVRMPISIRPMRMVPMYAFAKFIIRPPEV